MSVWNQPRQKPPVIIKDSLLEDAEDFDVVVEIFDFVSQMQMVGRYLPEELPTHAVQLHDAYIYDSEIGNGGHYQYIYNRMVGSSREEARKRFVCAHDGLIAMGCPAQADILRRMISWFDANAQNANEEMDFAGHIEELEPLDREFYEVNNKKSIVGLIVENGATWIKSWRDLKSLEDAEFERVYSALVKGNPQRLPRIASARIEQFSGAFEPFPVGIALAVAAANEVLHRIGDVHEANIGPARKMAWRVQTNLAIRYAAADEDGISLYEYVPLEDMPTSLGVHARSGAFLGRATAGDIDAVMNGVDKWRVASAADMLLRRARPDEDGAVLSLAGMPQAASWLQRFTRSQTDRGYKFNIVLEDEVFVLTQSRDEFTLSAGEGNQTLGTIAVQNVDNYFKSMMENR